MRCGFVILHYLTANDTIGCVESIEEKYGDNCEIVIVDNFSNNGSIEEVEGKLKYKNIHILKNNKNLGFARGNNVGYRYCREKLGLKTIVISNNDVIVESGNLIDRVADDVKKYNAAVIGPCIKSLATNNYQNPMDNNLLTRKDIKRESYRYKILYLLEKIHVYNFLQRIVSKRKELNHKEPNGSKCHSLKMGVQLHGAFLIFTEIFTNTMKNAFDERTFLYMEEAILKKKCDEKDLVMLYDPNIKILHREDSSTNELGKNTHGKRLFVFKNMVKSLRVLLDYTSNKRGREV